MTDETTPQDDKAMPPASVGSHKVEAWGVEWRGDSVIDRSTVCYTEDGAKRKADDCPALDGVAVPLYRQPQPALTDEEREAIRKAMIVMRIYEDDDEDVLESLLERTK